VAENITRRLDAWTAADRAAHTAAKQLLDRRLAYIKGIGTKPSVEEINAVQRMRAEAARLYRFAMDELEEIAARADAERKDLRSSPGGSERPS
jgi:hypothetical protein